MIVPGKAKDATPTNIKNYHDSHGHGHEKLLRFTAEQQGVELTDGPLINCVGCSMSKGQVKPVKRARTTAQLRRFFAFFSMWGGRMQLKSIARSWYTLIIRNDCTCWTRISFLKLKSDAADVFEKYLAEYRAKIEFRVRCSSLACSDNGREFWGKFAEIFLTHGIEQEFTPRLTPKYNGVAKRGLVVIPDAALAALIRAGELSPDAQTSPTLWAESASCACLERDPHSKWPMVHRPRSGRRTRSSNRQYKKLEQ